jgi:hypothetical protein
MGQELHFQFSSILTNIHVMLYSHA